MSHPEKHLPETESKTLRITRLFIEEREKEALFVERAKGAYVDGQVELSAAAGFFGGRARLKAATAPDVRDTAAEAIAKFDRVHGQYAARRIGYSDDAMRAAEGGAELAAGSWKSGKGIGDGLKILQPIRRFFRERDIISRRKASAMENADTAERGVAFFGNALVDALKREVRPAIYDAINRHNAAYRLLMDTLKRDQAPHRMNQANTLLSHSRAVMTELERKMRSVHPCLSLLMASVAMEIANERSSSLPGGGLLGMPRIIADASGIHSDKIVRADVIAALREVPGDALKARVAGLCEFAASVPDTLMRHNLAASQQAEKERHAAKPFLGAKQLVEEARSEKRVESKVDFVPLLPKPF